MSGKVRVLVVDDNREFCQTMVDILELKGFEALAAYDGFQALEMVRQDGYDLVLMDIKIPVMDGVATSRKMREIAPDTRVIMLTAYAVEDLIREALQEGAFGCLKKPVDFDELFDLIEQATAADGAMILVVDDDKDICANLKDVLEDKGYRVRVAYDGIRAIEIVQRDSFDIMLLDMKLPPLNGLETFLRIKGFRPNIVTIVITGYRQEMSGMVQQTLSRDAYSCLEKPIDMDELVSLLERIRGQKDAGTL